MRVNESRFTEIIGKQIEKLAGNLTVRNKFYHLNFLNQHIELRCLCAIGEKPQISISSKSPNPKNVGALLGNSRTTIDLKSRRSLTSKIFRRCSELF
ncbi:hypothetical protein HHI36_015314 [Cryptolaemus montrouzieri]|uniref:Uncharacterized protein n=1 Tax=Cryptolaemus montrouzieri TaxID=559131 RepID=A0ABD2N6K2_9CUCU